MMKNYILKASITSLVSLCSFSAFAADDKNAETWNDFSDPTAIYSNASIGGGNEGVDIKAAYGGYLGGVYKHRFTAAAKSDLEYYEFDYLLLNSATDSGVAFDSTWHRDIRVDGVNYRSVNDISLGFFAKLGFLEEELNYEAGSERSLNFYPKMSVGYMWADNIRDTTFIELDATTRFAFNKMFWIGVTPTYTYGMKGLELNEWTASLDGGIQLSNSFGINASVNNDKEFRGEVQFAF